MNRKVTAKLSALPDSPGIYLFFDTQKQLIYVGKATSLRSRARSYFSGKKTPRPIEEMIHEVADIKYKTTDSALEAIILESVYIKKFQPKYNVLGKDDKSWNYIVITKDEYPRVETARQRELDGYVRNTKGTKDTKIAKRFLYTFGPYPGLNAAAAMKLLRKMFRFSTCRPGQNRPCLYYQMGQCAGVCAGEISAAEYRRKVIRPLAAFLKGNKKQVIKMLETNMKREAKKQNFEEAGKIRNQLKALWRIQDIALLNKSFVGDVVIASEAKSRDASVGQSPVSQNNQGIATSADANRLTRNDRLRIEGYDISNLGETEKVASMVVFNEAGPVKSEYRKFIIKTVAGQSDVDCLAEVLERRLKHAPPVGAYCHTPSRDVWPLPNIFLIDGGRPQVNRVRRVVETHCNASLRATIPIVGIAKGPSRKKNDFYVANYANTVGKDDTNRKNKLQLLQWVDEHRPLLIQVRDEAHRFAITFHRARRGKGSLPGRMTGLGR